MNYKKRFQEQVSTASILLLGILISILPLIMGNNPYLLHISILTLINIILAMAWLLLYRLGLFSLHSAPFMTIGAYASALLSVRLGLSPHLTLLLAGLLAAIIGILIGYPVLKVRGLYFAIITFALVEVVRHVLISSNWLGSVNGIRDLPVFTPLFGIKFTSQLSYYYYILLWVLITTLFFARLGRSRIGSIFQAIRENPNLSESIGISEHKFKLIAFALSCFFTAIAGAFFGHYMTYVSPEMCNLHAAIMIQIYAIIGGTAFLAAGPIVGSIILTILPEILRAFPYWQPVIFGTVLVIVIIYYPGGIMELYSKFRARLRPGSVGRIAVNKK
jgi:branched-chain amino acid transport system permease protein